jgi:glycosyltransferase involved in cell wall biosynthesis
MRIGIVTGEYPPMAGGVGAFSRELGRALADQGHAVHVYTRVDAAKSGEAGIEVAGAVAGTWGWGVNRRVAEWAAQNDLDVVDIQYQIAAYGLHPAIHWLPGRIRDARVAVTFHDLRAPYLFPKAGPIREWAVRRLAGAAGGAIATNRADERTLREAWGIKHVARIPIGSNVRATPPPGYDRAGWRREMGVGDGDLLVSYFGFLNPSKGGLTLIEAVAALQERGVPIHLVMIGGRAGASDPADRAYAEQVDALIVAHRLDPHIMWTGFVADEAVSGYLLASDVTALPYEDGVSLRRGSLMAALAHGRAVVSTHPRAADPELEGAVETVPPGDGEALADALCALWKDAARREALERAALEAAAHFRWERIAAQTVDFFQALIGSPE